MRLTGLPVPEASILIGIETGKGPFGDTEPPVSGDPVLLEQVDRLVAKHLQANP